MKKLNTELFIQKSRDKFGDVLDYSRVEYINTRLEVCFICKTHGLFYQKPLVHLRAKHPCPLCAKRIPTNKTLIDRFIKIHGNLYNYTLVKYIGNHTNIKIVCNEHGVFEQTPDSHLAGKGCPKCANIIKLTTDEFIIKAKKTHGDKYDYSLSEYNGSSKKVKIICKVHGVFEQTPSNHYRYGCIYCSGKYLKENFIQEAIIAHSGKYDYSLVKYAGMFKPVIIICPKHGEFTQIPSNHLHHKKGCPKCRSRISRGESRWLDLLNVTERQVTLKIGGKKYFVDGFDKNTNTVYEYNGDYWHGNPKIYNQNSITYFGVSFGYLYNRTIIKQKTLQEAGYNVVSIWESDFNGKNY